MSSSSLPLNPGVTLDRAQISNLKDVFLLNPNYRDFALGNTKNLPERATLVVPLLLLILGIVVSSITAAAVVGTGAGGWAVVAVVAGAFLLLVQRSYRAYRRDSRYQKQGKLLRATLTDVSTYERPPIQRAALKILNVLMFIIAIVDLFSESSSSYRYRQNDPTTPFAENNLYEIRVAYQAASPSGATLEGKVKRNRPELRSEGLPQPGSSLLILYVSDQEYKVL
jgi:hypothetical protein